ncbi:MAG: hypothetical protein IT282_14880, partial [Bacteroidetes bacterium]|nr:hypothetical protein [Bacteroidota bacterium]
MGTTRRLMIALVVVLTACSLANAQVVWRSVASGDWGATTTWEYSTDGGSTWGAPSAVPATRDTNSNFIIAAGHTVIVEASPKYCHNLLVEAGAQLRADTTQPTSDIRYIRIKGDTLTVNGVFGLAADPDDSADVLSLQLYGPDQVLTINGTGTINICRIRPHTSRKNITVVFDADATITYVGSTGGGGSGLYAANDANNDDITYTVNAGRTVTLVDRCNLATSSSTSSDGTANTTFNIDGTVNLLGGSLNLRVAAGKSCVLNVTGTLNVGGNVYPTGASGVLSTISVSGSMNTGTLGEGTLYFDDPAQVVTGAGAFTVGAGATFRTGLPAGLPSASGQIQTATATFDPGANYAYVGSGAQVTGDLLPAHVRGLIIDNATGVTLSQDLLVDSTLTLTDGALLTGSDTLSLGSGALAARSSGYVDGHLKKVGLTGIETFPVGTSGGYAPVTITPLLGTGDFTVTALAGTHPDILNDSRALDRYWSLESAGIDSAHVMFVYPTADIQGNGAAYVAGRHGTGSKWFMYPTTVVPAGDTAFVFGVNEFSDWTLGQPAAFTGLDDPASMPVLNSLKTFT